MKFGISNNVKSRVVRECTPELFHQAMRSELVAEVCAEIADGLERLRRGELTGLKKRLPIFTPHATFRNGRRLNADAIPSGLSMYDVDHINDPRGYWEQKRQELEARGVMRYVVLAHITPSTEGLRLFFIIPAGMDLAEAQRWMSQQMGDENYDVSVKDYARSSFVVPEGYVLYLDEERLFNGELKIENGELPASTNPLVGTHHGASDDNEGRTMVRPTTTSMPPIRPRRTHRGASLHLRGCHIVRLFNNGSSWRVANPCRASATTSSIAWPRTCAISPTTTKRCSCK